MRRCKCGEILTGSSIECLKCSSGKIGANSATPVDWDEELKRLNAAPPKKPSLASQMEVRAEARRRQKATNRSRNVRSSSQAYSRTLPSKSVTGIVKFASRFAQSFSVLEGFVNHRGPVWTDVEYHTQTNSNTVGGISHMQNSRFDFFAANTQSNSVTRAHYSNYISKLVIGSTRFYDFPVDSREYLEALSEGNYIRAILAEGTGGVVTLTSSDSNYRFGPGFSTTGFTVMQVLSALFAAISIATGPFVIVGLPLGIFLYYVTTQAKQISKQRWNDAVSTIFGSL